MEAETMERNTTNENAKRQQVNGDEKNNGEQKKDERNTTTNYKDLTVMAELIGGDRVTMMELLKAIKENCGVVVGCRFKTRTKYEITMEAERGKTRLMDGFKIKDTSVMAKAISNKEMVVSFLGLPIYITDEEIREKLRLWGVNATSPIKRRKWPGTDILEGTRFCKVQFTDEVQSLPYSTRFDTMEGVEYFRVIHDRQVKVCRLCIQPGHILRECPEFSCRKCGLQGHYARECDFQKEREEEEKCGRCMNCAERCTCELSGVEEEAGETDQEEETTTETAATGDTPPPQQEERARESGAGSPGESVGIGSSVEAVSTEQLPTPRGRAEGRKVDATTGPETRGKNKEKEQPRKEQESSQVQEERQEGIEHERTITSGWMEDMGIETESEEDGMDVDRRAQLTMKRKAKDKNAVEKTRRK